MTKAQKIKSPSSRPQYLIGNAYDVHNLVAGKGLYLGGVLFPGDLRTQAHSDGDVLLHALANALLGAVGAGDIGMLFSDKDPAHKGVRSTVILQACLKTAAERGYVLNNLDLQVVCERVMIAPLRDAIVTELRELTGCE